MLICSLHFHVLCVELMLPAGPWGCRVTERVLRQKKEKEREKGKEKEGDPFISVTSLI